MIIRKYEPNDWLWLANFSMWVDGVGIKMKSDYDKAICYVAETDDEIIGFICGENTPLYGNLLIAAEVLPEYRKQGVFRSLLDEYKRHSDTAITVFHNSNLTEMYQKLGFTIGDQLRVSMTTI